LSLSGSLTIFGFLKKHPAISLPGMVFGHFVSMFWQKLTDGVNK
jgi:hypothetical protein